MSSRISQRITSSPSVDQVDGASEKAISPAQGLGIDPGIDRQKVLKQASGDPVRHESGQMGPQLVEFRPRSAMRRPTDTSFRPTTAGAAEARQPDHDQTEHGRNPVGSVVLDLARCRARPA
jgi:hypothetical protein